jgi:hypothetical protein
MRQQRLLIIAVNYREKAPTAVIEDDDRAIMILVHGFNTINIEVLNTAILRVESQQFVMHGKG